jgi:hypothetical protein
MVANCTVLLLFVEFVFGEANEEEEVVVVVVVVVICSLLLVVFFGVGMLLTECCLLLADENESRFGKLDAILCVFPYYTVHIDNLVVLVILFCICRGHPFILFAVNSTWDAEDST